MEVIRARFRTLNNFYNELDCNLEVRAIVYSFKVTLYPWTRIYWWLDSRSLEALINGRLRYDKIGLFMTGGGYRRLYAEVCFVKDLKHGNGRGVIVLHIHTCKVEHCKLCKVQWGQEEKLVDEIHGKLVKSLNSPEAHNMSNKNVTDMYDAAKVREYARSKNDNVTYRYGNFWYNTLWEAVKYVLDQVTQGKVQTRPQGQKIMQGWHEVQFTWK